MTSVTFFRRGEEEKPIFQDRQGITLSKGRVMDEKIFKWFQVFSPLEEPDAVTKDEMRGHITALVEIIKSMSGYNDFRAQTIVFWCIASYGFEDLR